MNSLRPPSQAFVRKTVLPNLPNPKNKSPLQETTNLNERKSTIIKSKNSIASKFDFCDKLLIENVDKDNKYSDGPVIKDDSNLI